MRLIDADKLKDSEVMCKVFSNPTDELYGMLQLINEQPIVDAVEVVRCKNCEYYKKLNITGYCLWNDLIYDNDAFYSHGERKGGAK